jgi:hypothetical protein
MKTDSDKFIARFLDTKFESTKGVTYEVSGKTWTGKQTNADIVFYLL